jgi:hypothetical protein
MLHKNIFNTLLAAVVLGLASHSALALTTEERGLEISREAIKRDTGWTDNTADMMMYLRNRQGQESIRELKIKTLEQEADGDKSLTLFKKPADVKGTAFLSFSHPVDADDQWLYLPALKRVKRISSSNKSGPFMGSEFAFEDLSSFEIEKYTYRYSGDESLHGLDNFIVEQFPVDKNSGYTRRLVWIDKEAYRVQRIDFYDRKNTLLKTLAYANYQQYEGQFWRADTMNMTNHQNGKSTELKWSNYVFKMGLKERDFDKNALKRIR